MDNRVSVTITDGVADVRLSRADKMNALDAGEYLGRFFLYVRIGMNGVD